MLTEDIELLFAAVQSVAGLGPVRVGNGLVTAAAPRTERDGFASLAAGSPTTAVARSQSASPPVNGKALGESESTTTPQLFAETSNEPCSCIAFEAWGSRTMMHALPPPGIPATALVDDGHVPLPEHSHKESGRWLAKIDLNICRRVVIRRCNVGIEINGRCHVGHLVPRHRTRGCSPCGGPSRH